MRARTASWPTRTLSYYLALSREAEPQIVTHDQVAWLNRLELEHDNLRAALNWGSARGGLTHSASPQRCGGSGSNTATWRRGATASSGPCPRRMRCPARRKLAHSSALCTSQASKATPRGLAHSRHGTGGRTPGRRRMGRGVRARIQRGRCTGTRRVRASPSPRDRRTGYRPARHRAPCLSAAGTHVQGAGILRSTRRGSGRGRLDLRGGRRVPASCRRDLGAGDPVVGPCCAAGP